MKTETEHSRIRVEFENTSYKVYLYFEEKKFTIENECRREFKEFDSILHLRQYINELAQIAKLIKDQFNLVHGYEFNEDVEKPDNESKEAKEFEAELQKKERIKKRYFKFFELPGIEEQNSNELKEWFDYQQAKRVPYPTSLQEAIEYGIHHKSEFMNRPEYWFLDIIQAEKEYSSTKTN